MFFSSHGQLSRYKGRCEIGSWVLRSLIFIDHDLAIKVLIIWMVSFPTDALETDESLWIRPPTVHSKFTCSHSFGSKPIIYTWFPHSTHLLCQDFILFPLGLWRIWFQFSSSANETEQDTVGPSQVQKYFCVPCFLFGGKRLQPPRPSLSSKWQIQTINN